MAMQSTLSFDSNERTKIITLKNIFVMIGTMVPTILVPMLAMNEEGANAQGFLTTGIIGAILVIICMFITFKATESYKYVEKSDTPKITWSDRTKAIFSNKPLILLALSIFVLSIMMALNGVQTYFVLDVLGKGDLVLTFSLVMLPGMLLAMAFMPIAMKFEKRTIMMFGSLIYAIASIIWFFVPNNNITLMLVLAAFRAWGLGFGMILMWSMLTDCVDYAKLKTGKQQGGIVFSTTTFMQKAAGGIGIALLNLALVIVGFIPGSSTQTAAAGEGVKFIMTIGCAVLAIVIVVLMIFYPLSKAKMKEIANQIGRSNVDE
jgi:Na+/melibiose symporter-like transporter